MTKNDLMKSQSEFLFARLRVLEWVLLFFVAVSLILGGFAYVLVRNSIVKGVDIFTLSIGREYNVTAKLEGSGISGQIVFSATTVDGEEGVRIGGRLKGLKPGSQHPLIILDDASIALGDSKRHEFGHLNPYNSRRHTCHTPFNALEHGGGHLGDLGRFIADEDGKIEIDVFIANFVMDLVTGKAIVLARSTDACDEKQVTTPREAILAFGVLGIVKMEDPSLQKIVKDEVNLTPKVPEIPEEWMKTTQPISTKSSIPSTIPSTVPSTVPSVPMATSITAVENVTAIETPIIAKKEKRSKRLRRAALESIGEDNGMLPETIQSVEVVQPKVMTRSSEHEESSRLPNIVKRLKEKTFALPSLQTFVHPIEPAVSLPEKPIFKHERHPHFIEPSFISVAQVESSNATKNESEAIGESLSRLDGWEKTLANSSESDENNIGEATTFIAPETEEFGPDYRVFQQGSRHSSLSKSIQELLAGLNLDDITKEVNTPVEPTIPELSVPEDANPIQQILKLLK